MNEELKGLIVPVLTPFSENGELDETAFARHLEFLAEGGIRRIMVNGTTGEFYALSAEERARVLAWARKRFDGLIVAHAGGVGLEENREEIRRVNDSGADAVAVLPPIYPADASEEGIIAYLAELEAVAELPFILYNFPKHTGNAITANVLREVPHFALKDSARSYELMEHTPRYFAGTSTRIHEPVQQGAAGFVAATANARPELYAAMEMLSVSAKVEDAAVMQQEIQAYSARFSAGGVLMLKQAVAAKLTGYPTQVRPPLVS